MYTNIDQADTRMFVHNKHAGIVLNIWMHSVRTLQSSAPLQVVLTSAQPIIREKHCKLIDTGQKSTYHVTLRRVHATIVAVERNRYCTFCVFTALVTQHAMPTVTKCTGWFSRKLSDALCQGLFLPSGDNT